MPQTLTSTITDASAVKWYTLPTTGNLSVLETGAVVLADASSGSLTVSLPSAAGANKNRMISVKKTDSTFNTVTISANGSETIDGSGTVVITVQNACVMMISDGSNWYIL